MASSPPSDGWGGALSDTVRAALRGQTLSAAGVTPAVSGAERPLDSTLTNPGEFMVRPMGAELYGGGDSPSIRTGQGVAMMESCELVLCVSADLGRPPRLPIWPAVRLATKAMLDEGWRDAPFIPEIAVEWSTEGQRGSAVVVRVTVSGWTYVGFST